MSWIVIGIGSASLFYLFLLVAAIVRMERMETQQRWAQDMRDGIDCRTIWFWQTSRFLNAGFTISQDLPSLDPGTWLDALATALRPTAIRDVTETAQAAAPVLNEARP